MILPSQIIFFLSLVMISPFLILFFVFVFDR
jgi:hypothetical protein